MTKLQIQQNNAFRAVLCADYDTPTVKLYRDANVDNVDVCMKKTTCKIVYWGINNLGPPIYNKLSNISIPNRELCSSGVPSAHVPRCRSMFGYYNVAYHGPVYYNSVPVSIR